MNEHGCRSPFESSCVKTAPVATFEASDSIWNGREWSVLYPPPQFPSGTERFRAVPSVSECFRVFPTIFQLSSERFRAVLSNSERFRAFPIDFMKNFKVHFL